MGSRQEKPMAEEKDIYDRLNELVFYGCGDEAEELFGAIFLLCRKIGSKDKQEFLYQWAKEECDQSAIDAEANGVDTTCDYVTGR
jgi:hypothetical protein